MERLNVGENFIYRFNLFEPDGVTPLPLASCSGIECVLINNTTVLATYTYPASPELTLGASSNQLKLEGLTSLPLKTGILIARIKLTVANVLYPVAAAQTDIIYVQMFDIPK